MINSRKIEDLLPPVASRCRAFLAGCAGEGVEIIITSTYRDAASQDALFAQGRTSPGKKVTNAKAGQSWHNHRCAFDVVPLRNGKPVWGTTGADGLLWGRVGSIGESAGLEWAGRWAGRMVEFAHFQYTGGLTLADLSAGKAIV